MTCKFPLCARERNSFCADFTTHKLCIKSFGGSSNVSEMTSSRSYLPPHACPRRAPRLSACDHLQIPNHRAHLHLYACDGWRLDCRTDWYLFARPGRGRCSDAHVEPGELYGGGTGEGLIRLSFDLPLRLRIAALCTFGFWIGCACRQEGSLRRSFEVH